MCTIGISPIAGYNALTLRTLTNHNTRVVVTRLLHGWATVKRSVGMQGESAPLLIMLAL